MRSTFARVGPAIALMLATGGSGVRPVAPLDGHNTTARVRRAALDVVLTESGVLRATDSATYRSPLEGRELEIVWLAPDGSEVQAGDLLVRLDTSGLETELVRALEAIEQVELELRAARVEREEAALALHGVTDGAGKLMVEEGRTELQLFENRALRLRTEHARLEPLLARGYITREEFDRAGLEADEAEARAALARQAFRILSERTHPAQQQSARLQLERREAQLAHLTPRLAAAHAWAKTLADQIAGCAIRALQPGLVVYEEHVSALPQRPIRLGDRVTASQGLITLPDLRRMHVVATVREADLARVKVGQSVRVTLDAEPDRTRRGAVARLGALARTGTGDGTRFEIAVDLYDTTADLRPSMNARLDIVIGHRPSTLLIPVHAVFGSDDAPHAFVWERGRWTRRSIQLGMWTPADVEVVSGLREGEQVSLVDRANEP